MELAFWFWEIANKMDISWQYVLWRVIKQGRRDRELLLGTAEHAFLYKVVREVLSVEILP